LYYTFTGVAVACYAGYLYTLVQLSYPRVHGQEAEVYKKDLSFHTGLVFIALGCSQVVTGILMNKFGDMFNKYRLASFGTVIVEISAIVSLVTYYTEKYWLCFICSALWGCSDTFFQSNTAALISLEFKGRLEGNYIII
jgi:MFS family permease